MASLKIFIFAILVAIFPTGTHQSMACNSVSTSALPAERARFNFFVPSSPQFTRLTLSHPSAIVQCATKALETRRWNTYHYQDGMKFTTSCKGEIGCTAAQFDCTVTSLDPTIPLKNQHVLLSHNSTSDVSILQSSCVAIVGQTRKCCSLGTTTATCDCSDAGGCDRRSWVDGMQRSGSGYELSLPTGVSNLIVGCVCEPKCTSVVTVNPCPIREVLSGLLTNGTGLDVMYGVAQDILQKVNCSTFTDRVACQDHITSTMMEFSNPQCKASKVGSAGTLLPSNVCYASPYCKATAFCSKDYELSACPVLGAAVGIPTTAAPAAVGAAVTDLCYSNSKIWCTLLHKWCTASNPDSCFDCPQNKLTKTCKSCGENSRLPRQLTDCNPQCQTDPTLRCRHFKTCTNIACGGVPLTEGDCFQTLPTECVFAP